MTFNFSKVLVALIAVSATTVSAVPQKRQTDLASCDFVLKPDVDVDSSSTNLFAEFNFAIGFALETETGGGIFNTGSNFTENADNTFNVHDDISADGKTAAETAAIINAWTGNTLKSIVTNWLVESVTCA